MQHKSRETGSQTDLKGDMLVQANYALVDSFTVALRAIPTLSTIVLISTREGAAAGSE